MSLENSLLKVNPGPISGEMLIPGSKSYANRMLVLAALNSSPVVIKNIPDSTDVLSMVGALREIGLRIEHFGSEVKVLNSFPECEKDGNLPIVVECGDGGTTTRFMSALVSAGKRIYHIEPSGGMRGRPVIEMINALKCLGAKVERSQSAWLSIQGPLQLGDRFELDCCRSTQFASALALVLRDNVSLMEIKEMKNSKAYYEMTLELIKKSNETLFEVPPDYSSASYPLAFAAVSGEVMLVNCYEQDRNQADSAFLDILKKSGAFVEFKKDGLYVKKNENLQPFEVSCSAFPDLAPTLAYFASFCDGESVMRDLDVLAHKESHRLFEIEKLLTKFEVRYESDGLSYLKIQGRPQKRREGSPVKFSASELPEDHRIIMVTYLFMRTLNGGELSQVEHVKKSFPNFFELMGEGR